MLQNKRKSAWRHSLLLIAAVMLIMTIAAGCGQKNQEETGGITAPPDNSEVVATYEGGEITAAEFDKYTTFFSFMNPQYAMLLSIPQYKEQFLQEYVGYKILYSRASDAVKEETNVEADSFEEQFKAAVDSQPEMKAEMDAAGLTIADTKQFYHLVVTVMKDAENKVTEDAIKASYEENPGDFTMVSVRHILVSTADAVTGEETRTMEEALVRANEAKDKLDAGGSWDELAKEYSDDPGSMDNGGLYPDTEAGKWVAEFKEASLNQEIGVIGEPVQSSYGYHVMQVEKREPKAYEQLTEENKTHLSQTLAGEVLNEFMTNELPGLIHSITLPQEEAPDAPETPDAGADDGGVTNTEADTDAEADTNKTE